VGRDLVAQIHQAEARKPGEHHRFHDPYIGIAGSEVGEQSDDSWFHDE
jgi:hypothetical protein